MQIQPYTFSFPADIFGILGILTTVVIYQQKKNQNMLWWKLATDVLWIVYYALQKNYSVVAITAVAIFRSIVLLNSDKKWAQGIHWMFIFMGISIVFSIIAWKDWTSILTMVSSLMCIGMYWYRDPKMVRILTIPAGAMFLTNVFLNFNWLGFLCESFLLISSIVGFIRLDLLPKIKSRSNEQ